MRSLLLCACAAVILSLTGCGTREHAAPTSAEAKSTDTECTNGDCCSSLSRAALLQKASEKSTDERSDSP